MGYTAAGGRGGGALEAATESKPGKRRAHQESNTQNIQIDSSPSRLRLQDLLGAFQRGERKITGGQVRQAAELGVPVPPTHLAGGFDAVGDTLFSFGGQTRR